MGTGKRGNEDSAMGAVDLVSVPMLPSPFLRSHLIYGPHDARGKTHKMQQHAVVRPRHHHLPTSLTSITAPGRWSVQDTK